MIGSVTAEVLDEAASQCLPCPSRRSQPHCWSQKKILYFSNLDQNDILAIDTLYRLYGTKRSLP